MSAVELLFTPIGLRVLGVGLFAILVGLGLAVFRHRRLMETIARIVSLTTGGHQQEARVLARASGRWARPLVAALGGEAPESTVASLGLDVVSCGIAFIGVVHGALSAVSMRVLPPGAETATDVGALLAGMAVLTPLTLIASATILRMGAVVRRRVRTAGVEIAVRQLSSPTTPASGRPRAAAKEALR